MVEIIYHLDAFFAKLYGLTEEELRYILDPQDVFGPDFSGETFRVLKEKEIRQFGEYRTKKLILEAWNNIEKELFRRKTLDEVYYGSGSSGEVAV